MAANPCALTRYSSARRWLPLRKAARASAIALALLAAGCGDDDEPTEQSTAGTGTVETTPPPPPTATTPEDGRPTATAPDADVTGPPSPEDQPGGAGDEIPASSQALLTGRRGTIRPRRVEVPPFIAIRVELRSADGRTYSIRFGRKRLAVGGGVPSRSRTFDGLRPGKRLVGVGLGGRVVIQGSAEPGP